MRVVRGDNSGKCVCMMLKSSSLETMLNILVRSTKTAALDGVFDCSCGLMMNFSIESCMALMMKSIPPSILTA